MKKLVLYVVLTFTSLVCRAQVEAADTLSTGENYLSSAQQAFSEDRYGDALLLGQKAYGSLVEEGLLEEASTAMALLAEVHEVRAEIDSLMCCLDLAYAVLPADLEDERLDILCREKYWARKYDMMELLMSLREKIREISQNTENPSVLLTSYFDMAEDAVVDRRPDRAEALYLKALELACRDGYVGMQYMIYGQLYFLTYQSGLYSKALDYAEKALAMNGETETVPGLDYYIVADCCYRLGLKEKARAYADSLLAVPAEDIMTEGRLTQYRGVLELLCGTPEKAYALLQKADSCMASVVPEGNQERVQILAQEGKALRAAGRFGESAETYGRYYRFRKELYGKTSKYGFKGLRLYAEAEMLAGHYPEAEALYSELAGTMVERVRMKLPYLTSEEREGYLTDMQGVASSVAEFAAVAARRFSPVSRQAYEAHLMTKELLFAAEKSVAEKVFRSDDPELRAVYYKWVSLRSSLSELEASAFPDTLRLAEVYGELHDMDMELMRRTGCSVRAGGVDVSFTGIRNALKDGEMLVDLVDGADAVDGRCRYRAFVLKSGWEYPRVVDICGEADLDSLLAVSGGNASLLCGGELALRAGKLLAPVISLAEGVETLYVVPSGLFHAMPFESFACGGEMLSDRFNVVRLGSARSLLEDGRRIPEHPSAMFFGGMSDDIAMTRDEAENARKALGRKSKVTVLLGSDATVGAFMHIDGCAPDILHIAGHGFCYGAADEKPASLEGRTEPMSLSGLFMYGDEPLSAADVEGMDLSGAVLVCLPACDSGRGKSSAEGLFGLQRAFRKAGAGYVLVSLWEVSDVSSALFMSRFYESVRGGGDVREAFEYAREKVRAAFPEPFYWAGFVLVR